MLKIIFVAIATWILTNFIFAQHTSIKNKNYRSGVAAINSAGTFGNLELNDAILQGFTFEMHNITNFISRYDLQSNGSPQQLWIDPSGGLNAVFTTSQELGGWADRTCTYFYSSNEGISWNKVGDVPPPANMGGAYSGFGAISGYSNGSIIIANHNNQGGGSTHTKLYVNSSPGQNDFVFFNPATQDAVIWPRLGVTSSDIVVIASAINALENDSSYTNTFNIHSGTFSGWESYNSGSAEKYAFGSSLNNKIANAYLDDSGNVWIRESNNSGLSWNAPNKIFEPYFEIIGSDTFLISSLRGVNVAYVNDNPLVVFETAKMTPDFSDFFPDLPSEIRFWNSQINNGQAIVIADSNNVPFFPNRGITQDLFTSLCRPVIGKASGDAAIYVAFSAASDMVSTTPDSTTFYTGYFMLSKDGGQTWTSPEKFAPNTTPPLDFRYISIAPINPVNGNYATVHMVVQGDPAAGTSIHPFWSEAKYYHFATTFDLSTMEAEREIRPELFSLSQNYPNPFNPVTIIKFSISSRQNVILSIYDILGRQVAVLINEEKSPGEYEIDFNADRFASGIYFYELKAGDFIQRRKMLLLK